MACTINIGNAASILMYGQSCDALLEKAQIISREITNESVADIIIATNELYGIDKKTAGLAVEAVREMQRDIYTMPYEADKKVIIISDGDNLSVSAQNALLKVFEEPPAHVIFILLARSAENVLPTIRSRCRLIYMPPESDAAESLLHDKGIADAKALADFCAGDTTLAAALAENEDLAADALHFRALFQKLTSQDKAAVYHIRDFATKKHSPTHETLFFNIMQSAAREAIYGRGSISITAAPQIIDAVNHASRAISGNANVGICMNELFLNIWDILQENI